MTCRPPTAVPKGSADITTQDLARLEVHHGDGDLAAGIANLERHLAHLGQYGVPVVVSINRFADDSEAALLLTARTR